MPFYFFFLKIKINISKIVNLTVALTVRLIPKKLGMERLNDTSIYLNLKKFVSKQGSPETPRQFRFPNPEEEQVQCK